MANRFKHIEMVGRLAKDDEIKRFEADARTAVFINNPGDIQYSVKSLSTQNDVAEEQFTGYISSIRNLDFVDDQYASDEERINKFSNHYKNTLFVFSHKMDTVGNIKIDMADIVARPSKVTDDSRFVAVPCFSAKSDCDEVNNMALFRKYETYDQFKQMLLDKKSIGKVYNFQINESTRFPEFVIWSDSEQMIAIGPIKEASRTAMDDLVLDISPDNYFTINLDDEYEDTGEYIVQSELNPTLIHITEEKYLDIVNRISQLAAQETQLIKNENKDVKQNETVGRYPELNGILDTVKTQEDITEKLRELPTEKTESEILDFFRYHSQMKKLFYAPKDVSNFHTAIKTGTLVILSGMSGTGKSALVDTYAKALGIEKNVLIIPVRPSWNDDSDLLGYVDLIHMVYRPSDTGFIDKIVEASMPENKDNLYLICLDEMNLARVEHYFSQFLSILEKPIGSRELVLYDEQYARQLYNSEKYPQRISIGDNVKFIGTVNIDESTYHFSDKVLDRANVITLDVLDYSQPLNWKIDNYRKANTPEWKNDEFNKLIKKDDVVLENQMRIRELLWKMHCMLHNINSNLGVGPRIVKSIETYLRNLPECDSEYTILPGEGIDYQVAQRVLTKIRGPEEQLKVLFDNKKEGGNALLALLDEFSDISSFARCRESVEQKEKELKIYGYCL